VEERDEKEKQHEKQLEGVSLLDLANQLSPKSKDINKQNAKHVYTEQQIYSLNFTLA
jgi:hypothetical protein